MKQSERSDLYFIAKQTNMDDYLEYNSTILRTEVIKLLS